MFLFGFKHKMFRLVSNVFRSVIASRGKITVKLNKMIIILNELNSSQFLHLKIVYPRIYNQLGANQFGGYTEVIETIVQ